MIEFWVGVDGGGTHTRARIRNNAGKLLGEGRAAGSNLELGIALAHGHVLAAIDQARIDAGLPRESEQRMGVGLALASAELADCYHAMLTMPFPFARVKLTSDAFGACLGAFDGQEGAILIAGTGSAGLIYREGRLRTCSGRGFPVSDLGSGAWLGLRAIQQSLLCHDGILPPQHPGGAPDGSLQAGSGRGGALGCARHPGRLWPLRPLGVRCRERRGRSRHRPAG
ncbi:hypothetical protein WP8S17E03_10840 [Aeromonas caviae]|nr:hypothetical protein WP8S17E03_10840 [Aeromonas caviae]